MFFLWCIFLLLLQLGIKAEPPSVSFVNLIPSTIANSRFIKENIIDLDFTRNRTFPSINIDPIFNANGSNCSRDIQILSRDLISRQIWALKSAFLFHIFFKLKIV